VTTELLARYDRPGPRYTSYPTAVEFHPGVGETVYEARLAAADERRDTPLSIYVHLPFCEHRCLFCGCNVIIAPDKRRTAPYLDLLRTEAAMIAERLPHRRKLSQLHLGGGTPTYFSPQMLADWVRGLFGLFEPTEGAELAVEADPRVTTEDHVAALAEVGFNRISFGVQDFTPEVQEAIGRTQPYDVTRRLVESARAHQYEGINVDLIYGLPFQTPEALARTVDSVVELGADRAAVYSFAYLPSMHGHMKRIAPDALPDRDRKFAIFAAARERFLAAGFEPIGMDHFARSDDELAIAARQGRLRRNFQGYSVQPADDVVGLGVSAIGDVGGSYVQNAKKLSNYQRRIRERRLAVERGIETSVDDRMRRHVIDALMCNGLIEVRDFERRFGLQFSRYFAEDLKLLREHEREGMVRISDLRVEATPAGCLFLRNLAMCFDAYLRRPDTAHARPAFSRTI
jgi:oxygen-independent coproporphyrinogen-3 oxidase